MPARRRRTLLLAAAAATLAAAAPAPAATISSDGTTITVISNPGEAEDFYTYTDAGNFYFEHTETSGAALTGAGSCFTEGLRVGCPIDGVQLVVASGDDRDDSMGLGAITVPVQVDGGGGADSLEGGPADDRITGGEGNDGYLAGHGGADVVDGGAGEDYIELGDDFSGDEVNGGSGYDSVNFAGGADGVEVTLDDVADDRVVGGPAGNVHSDVEGVSGSGGADTIVGGPGENGLSGNDGADLLVGGGGYDDLSGGDGADTLDTSDGIAEYPQCGGGADTVRVDGIDDPGDDCETLAFTSADADGDGSHVPADCNDADPSIRPGAPEVRGNGVDEDCEGNDAPAIDADGDGVLETSDCDDANPARRPGAVDLPRNGVDEDCTGADADYTLGNAAITLLYNTRGRVSRVLTFRVVGVPAGGRVRVACKGRGCPFRKRTVRGSGRRLVLTKMLRRARLRPGARIDVRAYEPGRLTIVRRVRFRAGRRAVDSTLCQRPGEAPLIPCG